MSSSPNLDLPYIMPSQAQKHVTHNEAIRALDAIVQLAVLDRTRTTPPLTPAEGDRHLVAAGATGDWAGQDGRIAAFQDGAWAFFTALPGWTAWDVGAGQMIVRGATEWTVLAPDPDPQFASVGINATADPVNRLAVASAATLLSHAGAGHRLTVNKATPADTGSLLFQSGWSGRAEMGLAGDDDFRVKVTGDGTLWHDALVIDRTTGTVTMPNTSGASWGGIGGTLSSQSDLAAALSAQQSLASQRPGAGRWHRTCTLGTTTVTLAGAANRIDLYPWRAPFTATIDLAGVNVTVSVAGAQGRVVVYGCDGDGNPDALLGESDLIDLSAVGGRSATLAMTVDKGVQYWLGIRHSAAPTLSAFQAYTTPDLDQTSIGTIANKILRRTHAFGSSAPAPWVYSPGEASTALATAIFLRAA